jgi:two-component sensor histidine kinase
LVAAAFAAAWFGLSACALAPAAGPVAKTGIFDLRAHDFTRSPVLELAGEWEFRPGLDGDWPAAARMRSVPDLWRDDEAGRADGQGAGSYRLLVLLPPDAPDLAVRYVNVATAMAIEANGLEVARVGLPSENPAEAQPDCRPAVAPLPASGNELVLVVRVSNYEYRNGGMWKAFQFGVRAAVEEQKTVDDRLAMVLCAFFLATAFHWTTSWLFRRGERSQLWFAVFTAALSLRPLITGDYLFLWLLPPLPYDVMVRLLYGLAFAPIPLAMLFFASVYPDQMGRRTKAALTLPVLPFFLLVAIAPLPVLTRGILAFYIVAGLCVAGLIFVLARAVVRRRPGAAAILTGAAVLGLAAANDSVVASVAFRGVNLLPIGLAVMVVIQGAVLSSRSAQAFRRVEELSAGIQLTNRRLEASLHEKDALIRDVHHWVKNSLQIVSSLISLEARRTEDAKVRERYDGLRAQIRSVSLVHEQLYRSGGDDSLELGAYLRELVGGLLSRFTVERESAFEVTAEDAVVSAKVCSELGLITAELVSNTLKYGLSAPDRCRVRIMVARDLDSLVLDYADDGPGFPPDFDPARAKTVGFRVISGIVAAHQGSIRLVHPGVSRLEIRYALPAQPHPYPG